MALLLIELQELLKIFFNHLIFSTFYFIKIRCFNIKDNYLFDYLLDEIYTKLNNIWVTSAGSISQDVTSLAKVKCTRFGVKCQVVADKF